MVKNLRPDDFLLKLDGVAQPVTDLKMGADTPITLGFLLDTSASVAGRFRWTRRQYSYRICVIPTQHF
jgi:hypothetical protein